MLTVRVGRFCYRRQSIQPL